MGNTSLLGTDLRSHIFNRDLEAVKSYLDRSPKSIDRPFLDFGKLRPLHYAVRLGHLEIVEYLLQRGSQAADIPDEKGCLPMHHACMQHGGDELPSDYVDTPNRAAMVRLLAEYGKKRILPHRGMRIIPRSIDASANGHYPLHMACDRKDLEVIQILLQLGSETINTPDIEGHFPIHYLVNQATSGTYPYKDTTASPVEMVQFLIAHGSERNPADPKGIRPAHLAIQDQNLEVLKLLLTESASIDATENETGNSVLHYAAKHGDMETMNWLLSIGSQAVNQRNALGRTPLYFAIASGQIEKVQLLIAHGSQLDITDKDGLRPFHYAISEGQTEILQCLLQHSSAEIDISIQDGWNAIHLAAQENRPQMIPILLQFGSQSLLQPNYRNAFPLSIAALRGRIEVINTMVPLIRHIILEIPFGAGLQTTLHYAILSDDIPTIQTILRWSSILNEPFTEKHLVSALYYGIMDNRISSIRALRAVYFGSLPLPEIIPNLELPLVEETPISESEIADIRESIYFSTSLLERLLWWI